MFNNLKFWILIKDCQMKIVLSSLSSLWKNAKETAIHPLADISVNVSDKPRERCLNTLDLPTISMECVLLGIFKQSPPLMM